MAFAVDVPEAVVPRSGTPAGRFLPALVVTVSLFFLWGMANNLNDVLIAQFRKAFTLSDFGTSFVQQVFYLGYFLLAVPASLTMRRFGYKTGIVVGLLLYGTGALMFYPAAQANAYPLFLLALFVIACGLAFLETSANPLVTELGDPSTAARRLNWAQAANPMGSIAGVFIGRQFILSGIHHDERAIAGMAPAAREAFYRSEVQLVAGPYLGIAAIVFVFALVASRISFPSSGTSDLEEGERAVARFGDLFAHRSLLAAVGAQFCYVGAQVGLWSFTIRYAQAEAGWGERSGADALFASLVMFAIGRFAGAALMARFRPARLLAGFAAVALALACVAAAVGGRPGLCALVAASFFMSIQFPTIFALGLSGLVGPLRRLGASLVVMAIIGGAVLTAVMGRVSDVAGIAAAMYVPAACFGAVIAFAFHAGQRRPDA